MDDLVAEHVGVNVRPDVILVTVPSQLTGDKSFAQPQYLSLLQKALIALKKSNRIVNTGEEKRAIDST